MSPGGNTAIVVDSTVSLPDDYVAAHDIGVVSLYVSLDGEQKREVEISDYREFYARLRASDGPATTSQPSIGDFIETYEPLLEQGREIVSVHISAGISGTFEAARQAAARLREEGKGGERIWVIDSKTAVGGIGICLTGAVEAAEAGASGREVAERFERARSGLETRFVVDTLEFLRKGGRIGGAQAFIGGALKVKPILTLGEQIEPTDKVRTHKRAMAKLLEFAAEAAAREPLVWAAQHIDAQETIDEMAPRLREAFGTEPLFVSEMRPVLGSHTGPGVIGVGLSPRRLVEA